MAYNVITKKKVLKGIRKLPLWVQKKMAVLANDLKEKGPEQPGTSWVACWKHEKGTIIIEVYYVGSREKAPY